MSNWNEAVERCVEGQSTPEELSRLLMRIDLPDEGRRAINAALSLVEGLDQIHRIPEPRAGAVPRLLDALRAQALPQGIESLSAWSSAGSTNAAADFPEADSESEAAEFRELAAALDSFHGSIPFPAGGKDRLLQRLGHGSDSADVRAAFGEQDTAPNAQTDDETDDNVPYRGYFTGGDSSRDVLAASRETPPPSTPAPLEKTPPQPENSEHPEDKKP